MIHGFKPHKKNKKSEAKAKDENKIKLQVTLIIYYSDNYKDICKTTGVAEAAGPAASFC